MADKVLTAEELERLTPAEQDALFDSSVVHDPSALPPAFLERVRRRAAERIAHREPGRS